MTSTDELDDAILALLTDDARMPVTGLAARLRVARSTVQQRLARLERDGVIAGYTIRRGGPPSEAVRAHVSIVVEPKRSAEVTRRIGAMPAVELLCTVSGDVDLVAVVAGRSAADLDGVLDAIGALPGVTRTTSSVVLSVKVDRGR